jgi:uncharacterized membrane protein
MDRMLVVIFDNEEKAIEGSHVLRELDHDGYIAVYDAAIVVKSPNGTTTMRRVGEYGPVGTLTGVAVGSLIGLLAGPIGALGGAIGAATGAVSGTLVGALSDFENVRVGSDFIADASKELVPSKVALVAEIEEEEITPLDEGMEALGGHVLRRSLHELKVAENDRDIATLKAEIAHSKAEHAKARAERKAKLEARIGALNAKLQQKVDQAKARHESFRRQAEAKVETLKAKAARARQDIKFKHEQRLATQLKQEKEYDKWLERLGS